MEIQATEKIKQNSKSPRYKGSPHHVALNNKAVVTIGLFDQIGTTSSLLLGIPGWEEMLILNFTQLDDLFRAALRYKLDFILLALRGELDSATDLVTRIKSHMGLSVIPTIVYHQNPTREQIKQGLESPADDFLWGEWDGELFQLKVKMIRERSHRDIAVNPTSKMPGPVIIEREVNKRLIAKEVFAVCYADVDDFKAYNDYYGYFFGDKALRLVARIIKDIVSDLSPESFVGHIGGDDFIFLIPVEKVDAICSNILKTFDRIIPYRYQEDDRLREQIVTENRRGVRVAFPLMTMSIAVLITNDSFTQLAEMSHMLADLKSYAKSLSGSNYMIERRKKY